MHRENIRRSFPNSQDLHRAGGRMGGRANFAATLHVLLVIFEVR